MAIFREERNRSVCPGSSDPFYIVSYYIKWVTTSWTYRDIARLLVGILFQIKLYIVFTSLLNIWALMILPIKMKVLIQELSFLTANQDIFFVNGLKSDLIAPGREASGTF